MKGHRRMDQTFVINELIALGGLKLPIQNQAPAKCIAVRNHHFLKPRFRPDQRSFQLMLMFFTGRKMIGKPMSGVVHQKSGFVLQQAGGNWQNSTLHFNGGHIFCFKFFRRVIVSPPGIDFRPAGEDIHRRVIVFGPGMDGEMRFGNHDHAGDSVRVKGVEYRVNDPRPGVLGGIDHDGFHFMDIVQEFGIAVVEFNQQMPPE
jgi:hypothetical protein